MAVGNSFSISMPDETLRFPKNMTNIVIQKKKGKNDTRERNNDDNFKVKGFTPGSGNDVGLKCNYTHTD